MVDINRVTSEFCKLVSINSPTFGERKMADTLKAMLSQLGFEVFEDSAGEQYESDTGNIFARKKGSQPGEPLLFSAHMDTVGPCENKKIIKEPDGRIHTDETTVLGADDASGIAAFFEAVRSIQESGAPHRDIEVLFTIAEEFFLKGSFAFDYSMLSAKQVYVLDVDGPIGTAITAAPTGIRLVANIQGKSAHAAIAPEDGINAIAIAASAIAAMKLGRIDSETTANIGIISGGKSGNIVPDTCFIEGETRSLSPEKAQMQLEHMVSCIENTAWNSGGTCGIEITKIYDAYALPTDSAVVRRFEAACIACGVQPQLQSSTGGSDNSVFSARGLEGIVVACGMHEIHSVTEYTYASELCKIAEIIEKLMTSEI